MLFPNVSLLFKVIRTFYHFLFAIFFFGFIVYVLVWVIIDLNISVGLLFLWPLFHLVIYIIGLLLYWWQQSFRILCLSFNLCDGGLQFFQFATNNSYFIYYLLFLYLRYQELIVCQCQLHRQCFVLYYSYLSKQFVL